MTLGQLSLTERQDLIRYVAKNWEKFSTKEMAGKFSVHPASIANIASVLRRKGINLPRKSFSSIYTPDFLEELKKLR